MPHMRMEIHNAVDEANKRLSEDDFLAGVSEVDSLEAFATLLGGDAKTAFQKLHSAVQTSILAVVKDAASDGRPVYLTWRHGMRQSVLFEVASQPGLPIDVAISSRYDEDGFGPPSTA